MTEEGLLQLDRGSLDAKAFAYLDLRPPNGSLGHYNRQSQFLWFDRLDVPWISCLDSESRQGTGLFRVKSNLISQNRRLGLLRALRKSGRFRRGVATLRHPRLPYINFHARLCRSDPPLDKQGRAFREALQIDYRTQPECPSAC